MKCNNKEFVNKTRNKLNNRAKIVNNVKLNIQPIVQQSGQQTLALDNAVVNAGIRKMSKPKKREGGSE